MGRVDESFDNWTVQVRKGILELCILSALASRERYGFDLIRTLTAVPGLGVSEGTLYPLLSRLRLQGLVKTRIEESPEGPARKYYALTREGRRTAELMTGHLETLLEGVRRLRRGEER
jgi:PadR family transcriptional regulator PadR